MDDGLHRGASYVYYAEDMSQVTLAKVQALLCIITIPRPIIIMRDQIFHRSPFQTQQLSILSLLPAYYSLK